MNMSNNILAIDIETFSDVDLVKCGVYKYVESKEFKILLVGYKLRDNDVKVVDLACGEELPREFVEALYNSSVIKSAFNANFEITCLKKYFPTMPTEQWECTRILALYNSLPSSLAGVASALGLAEQKDTKGKNLIKYFSQPCLPTKANGGRTRNLPAHDLEKWEEYKSYNRQDVVVESAIRDRLENTAPSDFEWQLWRIDQEINARGAMVDVDFVDKAISIDLAHREKVIKQAKELTKLSNPNSVSQLKSWLTAKTGETFDSLNKKTVSDLLKKDYSDDVKKVLSLRQKLGKTSVKKYMTMKDCATENGRIHGMFQFYGASRTGRWAGRLVQLHNLPRNKFSKEELIQARNLVKFGDVNLFEMCYPDVSDTLSQLIRTAIIPKKGCRFIVDDFSAIEARVIAWLAGEKWRQDVFKNGGDIYCASASAMFHVPVVKHGINGHLRQKGKIAELALGYGGSVGALKQMGADRMGLEDEELIEIVHKWRSASPKIVKFWYDVENAAKNAIEKGGRFFIPHAHISFARIKDKLIVQLPSSRELVYINPRIGVNRFGSESIVHDGLNQTTKQWGRMETYGGKLVENIVQATARDCLGEAMKRLTAAGYKIVMHVHDEVIIEAPLDFGSLDDVTRIMSENSWWESGLIKNADGFESDFYMKD